MAKTLSTALLATVMALMMNGVTLANDPVGGQANPQLNTPNSPSGSSTDISTPEMRGTSKSDLGTDSGLKANTPAAPCARPNSAQFGSDTTMKSSQDATIKSPPDGTAKSSAAEAARNAMANVKKADSSIESDVLRNPEARSSAETRLETNSNPCPENSGMMK